MAFDFDGALRDGATPSAVADYLAAHPEQSPVDIKAARAAGYSDDEIINHYRTKPPPMAYDIPAALKAGVTPPAILDQLQANPAASPYDVAAARKAGLSDRQIIEELHPGATNLQLDAMGQPSGSFDVHGALQAGYSPKELADYLAANNDQSPVDVAGRAAGYSDDEIVNHYDRPTAAQRLDDVASHLTPAAFDRGLAHAARGVAETARVLGAGGVGEWIDKHVDQRDLAAPSSLDAATQDINSGNYLRAATHVPGAVLEGLPQLAAVAGAGAAGGAVAGPVGALVGAGTAGAAMMGGETAEARARANGRTAPNAADIAIGMGGSAALNAIPGIGPETGMAASTGLRGALGQVVKHATADTLNAAGQQALQTAGTTQGLTLDPAALTAQAATGAATRGTVGGLAGMVNAAARATPAAREAALQEAAAAMTPDDIAQARAAVAAHQAVTSTQDTATGDRPSYQQAARTAARDLKGTLGVAGDYWERAGILGGEERDTLKQLAAVASDPKQALTTEHLAALDGLALPPEDRAPVETALRSLDLLAEAGAPSANTDGTVTRLGRALGHIAGLKVAAMTGGHSSILTALLGQSLPSMGADAVEGMVNRMGLTGQPSLAGNARRAGRMLEASGIALPDNTVDLANAQHRTQDVIATQAALMGMDPSAYSVPAAERVAMNRYLADRQMAEYMNRDIDLRAAQQRAMADYLNRDGELANAQHRAEAEYLNNELNRRQAAADAQDVQKQAQQQVDQSAFSAAVKLAMGDMAPSAQPGVGDTAQAAAIGQAMRRAEAVRLMAAQGTQRPAQAPQGPLGSREATTGSGASGASLGASAEALGEPLPFNGSAVSRQGDLLPAWQWGLGNDLSRALHLAGMPKAINPAAETLAAVQRLRDAGVFDHPFAAALMGHNGRIVRGLYNAIRNDMLMAHGIDRRTAEAQGLALRGPEAAAGSLAAE